MVRPFVARSRRTSSSIDERSGCLLASAEGGDVTCTRVLNARRNWRADRFSGKTYSGVSRGRDPKMSSKPLTVNKVST